LEEFDILFFCDKTKQNHQDVFIGLQTGFVLQVVLDIKNHSVIERK